MAINKSWWYMAIFYFTEKMRGTSIRVGVFIVRNRYSAFIHSALHVYATNYKCYAVISYNNYVMIKFVNAITEYKG